MTAVSIVYHSGTGHTAKMTEAVATAGRWFQSGWRDKSAAGFTVSMGPSGDKLSTLHYMFTLAMQQGMVWIGMPELPLNDKGINRLSSYCGVMGQAGQEPVDVAPNEADKLTGELLGKRVAETAKRWLRGKQAAAQPEFLRDAFPLHRQSSGVLRQLIRSLRVDAHPAARRLGLVREHAAIAARHARVAQAWKAHLERSHAAIREAAQRCARKERVLVVGAGDCLDVPVADLAAQFREVILADVVISPVVRELEKNHSAKVRGVVWDATGALETLARRAAPFALAEAVAIFEQADPGPPPGGEPDLVVSANCLSQIGLVPAESLATTPPDPAFTARCAQAAARRHVRWLAERPGRRLLMADAARLNICPDGKLLRREPITGPLGLPLPDLTWRWDLAPIPEWSRRYHRVHEVGGWIDDNVKLVIAV